ncbi:IS66 family insertion sequence element accessory protein TnpB [Caballeronia calidae]
MEQALGLDPFARAVYVFRNRRADRLKLLLWEPPVLAKTAHAP